MVDTTEKTPAARRPKSGSGAVLFTLGGLAAAFGVASCCALPLLLTMIGVSTAWLGGLALLAAPHRDALLIVGAICLAGARHSCGASGGLQRPAGRTAPARRPRFGW